MADIRKSFDPGFPNEPTLPAARDARPPCMAVLEGQPAGQCLPGAASCGVEEAKGGNGSTSPGGGHHRDAGRKGGLIGGKVSAARKRASAEQRRADARAWRLKMKPYFDALYPVPQPETARERREAGMAFARAWRLARRRPTAGNAPWIGAD